LVLEIGLVYCGLGLERCGLGREGKRKKEKGREGKKKGETKWEIVGRSVGNKNRTLLLVGTDAVRRITTRTEILMNIMSCQQRFTKLIY